MVREKIEALYPHTLRCAFGFDSRQCSIKLLDEALRMCCRTEISSNPAHGLHFILHCGPSTDILQLALSDPDAQLVRREGGRVYLTFDPERTATAELISRITAKHAIRDLFVENPPIEELIARLYREVRL